MLRKKIAIAAKTNGKKAFDYLTIKRRLSIDVIDKFDIGYCPQDINHELSGRIITPIYDTYGEMVAISTRHIDENRKNRFWHESFEKGYYLYGLYQAKEAIRKYNKVIIVEGEIDALVFHSYGFKMTVCCCGSTLTLFQVALLSRYCTNFYLLFDGDVAGRESIKRTMEMYRKHNLVAYGLNFIPTFLPEDVDPDEFLFEVGEHGVREKLKESRKEYDFI